MTLSDKTIEKIREAHERNMVTKPTDQYTPKPGDLVQLKSGGVVMTAVPYVDLGTLDVACYYDHECNVTTRVVPVTALMPAELEDEPSSDVMQTRVDALREALREVIRCTDENYNAYAVAIEALRADNLLNDEETDEGES